MSTYANGGKFLGYAGKTALAFDTAGNLSYGGQAYADILDNGFTFSNTSQLGFSTLGLGGNYSVLRTTKAGQAFEKAASRVVRQSMPPDFGGNLGLNGGQGFASKKPVHNFTIHTARERKRWRPQHTPTVASHARLLQSQTRQSGRYMKNSRSTESRKLIPLRNILKSTFMTATRRSRKKDRESTDTTVSQNDRRYMDTDLSESHVFVALVELKPLNDCLIDAEEVAGAAVRCYVSAHNADSAVEMLKRSFRENHFKLIEIDWCVNESQVDWENPYDETAQELIASALASNEVFYGEFHVWGHGATS